MWDRSFRDGSVPSAIVNDHCRPRRGRHLFCARLPVNVAASPSRLRALHLPCPAPALPCPAPALPCSSAAPHSNGTGKQAKMPAAELLQLCAALRCSALRAHAPALTHALAPRAPRTPCTSCARTYTQPRDAPQHRANPSRPGAATRFPKETPIVRRAAEDFLWRSSPSFGSLWLSVAVVCEGFWFAGSDAATRTPGLVSLGDREPRCTTPVLRATLDALAAQAPAPGAGAGSSSSGNSRSHRLAGPRAAAQEWARIVVLL